MRSFFINRTVISRSKYLALILSVTLSLVWTTPILALDEADGIPIPIDALIVRPIGLAAILVGSAIFVASLPFSVPVGGTGKAADELVLEPVRFTFKRPLGEYKKRGSEDSMRGWVITQNPESRILKENE